MLNFEICQIGEVKDAAKPLGAARETGSLEIEVGDNRYLLGALTITQDAALELQAKLTQFLKARGCL
jgi:hypothetical protein